MLKGHKGKNDNNLIDGLVKLRQLINVSKLSDIKRGWSDTKLRAHYDSLLTLCDTVIDLMSFWKVEELMELIITRAAGLLQAKDGFFYLYNSNTKAVELRKAIGFHRAHIGYHIQKGVGLTGAVLKTAKPLSRNDYRSWEGRHPDSCWDSIYAITALPLVVEGEVMGVIGLAHTEPGKRFTEKDIAILTCFAAIATLAMVKATLSAQTQTKSIEGGGMTPGQELEKVKDQFKEMLVATVNALSSTVELKDPYTAAHQRWVTRLACVIAAEMGLSKEQIEGIRMAGLVHDIGKMHVPLEFLNKPGKLSTIEYDTIKIHPQSGYDILKEIQFPWPVAQIVLQHHERMNGSGYPRGLTGDEILLEARLVAVADVVESMASPRPYRDVFGVPVALEEISRHKSTLYDTEVVNACLRVFEEQRFKFDY
jgi:putative nucleotidyltransferase with HDIG domain